MSSGLSAICLGLNMLKILVQCSIGYWWRRVTSIITENTGFYAVPAEKKNNSLLTSETTSKSDHLAFQACFKSKPRD